MTSYYLAIGFYITLMVSVAFLRWAYKSKPKKNPLLLSNTPKVHITGKETIQTILNYSKTYKS
jgi:hypothetical protein